MEGKRRPMSAFFMSEVVGSDGQPLTMDTSPRSVRKLLA
jgi:hypothetical protein